jgi:hypothetical protein
MAAVKEITFEAIDLAVACESENTNRYEALSAWGDFRTEMVKRYGEDITAWLTDIYDSIADRSGDYWELYQESK